jgi:ketosteroid isomerase-like protein
MLAAMSQENLEIVRAFFEAWNAGDMDALSDLVDPDVILRTVKDWPEPGPYVGREAVVRFTEQLRETFDADTLEPIGDFVDVSDHVVARLTWSGEGHGPQANIELTDIFTVRNGKIISHEFFWDHTEALEAVGLSNQSTSKESVALVWRAREAFNRRDLRELAELSHDDLEFVSVLTAVDAAGGTYHGPGAWASYFARMDDSWENWKVEDFRVFDAGDDRVAAVFRLVGTGKSSGARVERSVGVAYQIRDGKIWRLRSYLDPGEALEAVGLSEQDAQADSS